MYRLFPTQRDLKRLGRWLFKLFVFVTKRFALALETLLRHGFGESYLSTAAVSSSLVGLWTLAFVQLLPDFPQSRTQLGLDLTLTLVLSFTLLNEYIYIQRRNQQGQQWHSWDNGTPRLTTWFGLNELVAKQYIEPLLIGLFGFVMLGFASYYGPFIIAAAVLIAYKEFTMMRSARQTYLNIINNRVKGQRAQQLQALGWNAFFAQKAQQLRQQRARTQQNVQQTKAGVARLKGVVRSTSGP